MTEEKKRRHRFPKVAIIKLLATDNPKRKGTLSFDRFALYRDGITIADYVKAGGRSGDIKHDISMKYIELELPQA
jgi:hypothetical protein